MYLAIVIVAVIILALWLSNLGHVFQTTKQIHEDDNSDVKWSDIRNDLNEAIQNTRTYFKDNVNQEIDTEATLEDTSSSTLITNLINAAKEISSPTSTSPELGLEMKDNSSCPKWINCMPMVDTEPKPCQIPVGCEGITQIVY